MAVLLLLGVAVSAAQAVNLGEKGLNGTADGIGYTTSTTADNNALPQKIGFYINVATSLLGMVFMVFIWIGALDIVGAGGNEAMVKKGRDRIKNGAVGLFIILAAYFITRLIIFIVGSTGYFSIGE